MELDINTTSYATLSDRIDFLGRGLARCSRFRSASGVKPSAEAASDGVKSSTATRSSTSRSRKASCSSATSTCRSSTRRTGPAGGLVSPAQPVAAAPWSSRSGQVLSRSHMHRFHLRTDLSLRPLAGPSQALPRAELFVSTRGAGLSLAGAWLEAAVACDAGTMLFVTDDIPSEDHLHLHWVSPAWNLLDSARLGGLCTTGSFSGLQLGPPGHLSFRFIGGTDWHVQLHPQPRWRCPWGGEAPGVWRAPGWRRWFTVSGQPLPAMPVAR